jgi:hypothetical protein
VISIAKNIDLGCSTVGEVGRYSSADILRFSFPQQQISCAADCDCTVC